MPEHVELTPLAPEDVPVDVILNKNLQGAAKKSNTVPVQPDKKFVVFGMYVVDQAQVSDLPTIKAAVNAITGVTASKALLWGQSPETIPAGKELVLHLDMHLRCDTTPEVPE